MKKCLFCGRFFTPDPRVGDRQKACQRKECQKARKQLAQSNWLRRNPSYFENHYEYVKKWRKKKASNRQSASSSSELKERKRSVRKVRKHGNGSFRSGWYLRVKA